MRALSIVVILLASGGWIACASLKDAQEGPADAGGASPEASTEPDAATAGDGGGDASKDAAPPKGGDPRWPQWPLPADDPANASFTVASGPDGSMVTDTVTGLVWQDTVPTTTRDFPAATLYCDELVYDGLSDWRLPTRMEAISIMSFKPVFGDSTMSAPAFSAVAGAQCFWTGSTFAPFKDSAWNVTPAAVDFANVTTMCAARCVRGAPLGAPIPKQYDLIDASTLRDPATSLVWERVPPEMDSTWDEANARCKMLPLAGRVWRLPGVKELASIVDETKSAPAASGAFGNYVVRMFTANVQWTVDFGQGGTSQGPAPGFRRYSRCVSGP